MSASSVLYHFPDSATFKRNVEWSPQENICGFDKEDLYFCEIKKLAIEQLSNTTKTEDELLAFAQSFYEKHKGRSYTLITPFTGKINIDNTETGLINRIKNTLIELARIGGEEIDRVQWIKSNKQYDPSVSDLYIAIDWGFTEEAKELIQAQPELIHQVTHMQTSPLHVAVHKGNLEIVRLLLEAGADLRAKDCNHFMPLDFCIRAVLPSDDTHFEILEALRQAGEKLELKIGDISTSHLLFNATVLPKEWLILWLFQHGVETEKQGYESLKEVVKKGRDDIVKVMLNHNIPVDPIIKGEQSALHASIFCDHFAVFLTLLKAGANVNIQDEDGVAPLHVAAWQGKERMMEILLEKGANINIRDLKGYAPIHYAHSSNHKGIVKKLKDLGAQLNIGSN